MKLVKLSIVYSLIFYAIGNHISSFAQVVINEVMINPLPNAGSAEFQSLVHCGQSQWGAEYIELYNTDDCNPIDISCYVIGFRTDGFSPFADRGTFRFPEGTIIPPLGFISIGGPLSNSTINLFDFCGTPNLTTNNVRWYIPNGVGYIMLWNPEGETEDAVWWRSSNAGWGTNSDLQIAPNNYIAQGSSGCPNIANLQAPSSLPASSPLVSYAGAGASMGTVIHRTLDGGTDWATNAPPSINACNGACADPDPDCEQAPVCEVPFTISLSSTPNENCDENTACTGTASVEITSDFENVTYNYSWNDANNQDTPQATGLCAGEYCVTVTDASGLCIETACITVVNEFFEVSTDVTQPTCGDANGAISVAVSPQDNYTYTWSHDADLNTNEAQNLGNGTYTITVGTADCEVQVQEILFSEGISGVNITTSATTCGANNGSITVNNVIGGLPGYSYFLNNDTPQSGETFNNLAPGIYDLNVVDVNGCTFLEEGVVIDESQGITAIELSTIDPDCDAENGAITIDEVFGGSAPYIYAVNDQENEVGLFTGFGAGNFIIQVTDSDGCTYQTSVTFAGSSFDDNIEPPNVITANGDNVNDIWFIEASCLADFKGVIINRWGNEIKQLSLENDTWDGRTANGEKVTEGVYFYKATLTFQSGEEKNIHGFIHVIN